MDTNPEKEVAPLDDLMNALGDDEQETVDETEEAAPDEVEADAEEGDPDEDTAEPEAPELDEVELDGEKYQIPKKVAEAVLRQQDYTKKTQALADTRRAVEDKQKYLDAVEQMRSSAFTEAAELQSIKSQLEQYDALDWGSLISSDMQQAMQLNVARQKLQTTLQEKHQKLQGVAQQIQAAAKKHEDEQRQLSQAELQRRIGKMTDQDRTRLMGAAQELGFEDGDLWNPRALHALHLAAKYLALQKTKPQALKKVSEAPKVIKPMATPPKRTNKAAAERLKDTGRAEELINFL